MGKSILEKENKRLTSALLRRNQARLGTIEGARRYSELISLIETYFYLTKKKKEIHVCFCVNTKVNEPPALNYIVHN